MKIETFERFMLAQDAPTQSTTFILEFNLDGELDRNRLRQALSQTVLQHPIAAATIDDSLDHWDVNWRPPELLDGIDIEALITFDLHTENGIRLALSNAGTETQKLILVVHHACLDALGALQFIGDLAANYASPPPSQSDARSDRSREAMVYLKKYRWSYGGNRLLQVLRWPFDLLIMSWALEMIINRPTPISAASIKGEAEQDGDASPRSTRTKKLDQNELAQAQTIARMSRQTLNDHLLSSCFLAIEHWLEKFDPANTKSLIRVLIPVNLRHGTNKSASNMVAMVNMDKKPGKLKTVRSFRKLLSFQMDLVKRLRTGVTANRFLALQHRIFGRWRMFEDDTRCHASCIVSNLGDISQQIGDPRGGEIRFGQDTAVRSVHFVGPIRGQTHLCIHVLTYMNRMSVVATYNVNKMTPQQVDFLLDDVAGMLLSSDAGSDA